MQANTISAISESIIALVSIVGIYNLVLAKRTLSIGSQRKASEFASTLVDNYLNKIIPIADECDEYERTQNFPKFNDSKINLKKFTYEEARAKYNNLFFKTYDHMYASKEKSHQHLKLQLKVANLIESFSTSFIKGVADEELAYSSVGHTFCSHIQGNFYFYCTVRWEGKNIYNYENTIKLFNVWSDRVKKENLEFSRNNIEAELRNVEDKKITPLGL
jgi:hypothetical protein